MAIGALFGTSPAAKSQRVALLLGVAFASSIGGMGTILGTPPNLILAGAAKELLGVELDFFMFLKFGLPVMLVLLPACWILLVFVFHRERIELGAEGLAMLKRRRDDLGRLEGGERAEPLPGDAIVLDRDLSPADFLVLVPRNVAAEGLRHQLPAEAVADHGNVLAHRLANQFQHRGDPGEVVVHRGGAAGDEESVGGFRPGGKVPLEGAVDRVVPARPRPPHQRLETLPVVGPAPRIGRVVR